MLSVSESKLRPLPTVKPVTLWMVSSGVESTPSKETSAVVPAAMKMTLLDEGVAELLVPEADAPDVLLPAEERPETEGLPEETLLVKPAELALPRVPEIVLLTALPEASVGTLTVEAGMLLGAEPEADVTGEAEPPVEVALSEDAAEAETPLEAEAKLAVGAALAEDPERPVESEPLADPEGAMEVELTAEIAVPETEKDEEDPEAPIEETKVLVDDEAAVITRVIVVV